MYITGIKVFGAVIGRQNNLRNAITPQLALCFGKMTDVSESSVTPS